MNSNPSNTQPIFCLSLDFELLIGYHDLSNTIYEKKKKEMTDVRVRIHELIDVLAKNGIECTWAVVSHLFLESCEGHDDYPDREWLFRDSGTSLDRDPLWYAPDLIERLVSSDVNFEIGCHSFSHAVFDKIGEDQARYELRMSEELAKDRGIKLKSFIFPRNREAHLGVLSAFGIQTYRRRAVSSKSRMRKALDLVLATNVPDQRYL